LQSSTIPADLPIASVAGLSDNSHRYGYVDMGAHMKTTIELNDALLTAAKSAAAQQGTTLRAVVESALRGYLDSRAGTNRGAFRLRRHAFQGRGLQPEAADAGWERILEMSYEGRG
jgi:Arc/MetJ family transcription regulator